MEADMVIEMVNNLQNKKGIPIDGIIGDEDSTTIARLRASVNSEVKKFSDQNHLKKVFGNSLYSLRKNSFLSYYICDKVHSKVFELHNCPRKRKANTDT
jgi:hypothetical protein